ncbi:MAG: HAMP domain-containing histidine kinase [Oscillospiraceae bacterium]|nr:HAMP domain-containing histidine kinase [Oscillospiraceae bacterium]
MNGAKKRKRNAFFQIFWIFFLLIAFVLSSSMFLFLNFLERDTGIEYTMQNIGLAAVVTFGNVFMLSLVCSGVDTLRRKHTVERPVIRIIEGAEQVMDGDFSVRIEHVRGAEEGFNVIIDYFNRMVSELGGMETLRTDFIANVSHELKTPLSVIQNYGTLLQQPGLSDAERMDYATTVTGAARRLASLITNILKLNKLENQQIYPTKQSFDLGEQLCECLLDFEDAWEKKELEIETEIEDDVHVESDPELLSLVWNNLFSNAIKFTEPGGTVGLKLHTEADQAVVEVSDTGCGISADARAHIFEKFYQGDSSHATQGNGLGLALVKRVIDIVGGEVDVKSEAGKGSVFTVRLKKSP